MDPKSLEEEILKEIFDRESDVLTLKKTASHYKVLSEVHRENYNSVKSTVLEHEEKIRKMKTDEIRSKAREAVNIHEMEKLKARVISLNEDISEKVTEYQFSMEKIKKENEELHKKIALLNEKDLALKKEKELCEERLTKQDTVLRELQTKVQNQSSRICIQDKQIFQIKHDIKNLKRENSPAEYRDCLLYTSPSPRDS